MNELCRFIEDENTYSLEHFIISESKSRIMKGDSYFEVYEIDEAVYKKYVNNIFNFIFLDKDTNSKLSNLWLPGKIDKLDTESIRCEYSRMIINKLYGMCEEIKKRAKGEYKDNLDLFFARDFKELYIAYAREVLEEVIKKIQNGLVP